MTWSSSNRRDNNFNHAIRWNAREKETGLEVLLACTEGNRDEDVPIDLEEEPEQTNDL